MYKVDVKTTSEPGSEKVRKQFSIDIHQISQKSCNRVSDLFARLDTYFLTKHAERKDLLRMYRDIPLPLNKLYHDSDYVLERHGHDI